MKKQVATMAIIAMMSFGTVCKCVAQDAQWKTTFLTNLTQNINYPSAAQTANQEGKFYARFTIKEGKVKDLTVCETAPDDGTLLNEIVVVGYKHTAANTRGDARKSFTDEIQRVMQHTVVAAVPEQADTVWVIPFSFFLQPSRE